MSNGRAQTEFDRRGELVSVTVWLERGALEDLTVLCRHHYGEVSRSEVVRLAVRLLLAREAVQVVRGRDIDRRRAERAVEEARALNVARARRDQERTEATLAAALEVARSADPSLLGDGSASGRGARLVLDG
jgi:Arc/MetJ-type ribon-helix-helix transcriptional regulator